MHFNGRFIHNLIQFAAQQGADTQQLIALTGKSSYELNQEVCHLGPEAYNAVLEKILQDTGDELFGLNAGNHHNLQAAGLIVQIVQTSQTVRQALEYCCEFANLGCSALPTQLIEEKDHFRLTITPDPVWARMSPLSVRHTVYGYLSFTLREFESLTRYRFRPKEIWLTFNSPKNTTIMENILGCPIRYNREFNALFFNKEHVTEKVITSDFELLRVLVSHAYEKLENMKVGGFYEVVKRSVVNMVKPEFPTIGQVAVHLNLSIRTFQRKLSDEGHTFKEVIDELRKDFALDYLMNPALSISQIAYLLSYGDASAFVRSFRRWVGMSPGEYRRSQL